MINNKHYFAHGRNMKRIGDHNSWEEVWTRFPGVIFGLDLVKSSCLDCFMLHLRWCVLQVKLNDKAY